MERKNSSKFCKTLFIKFILCLNIPKSLGNRAENLICF